MNASVRAGFIFGIVNALVGVIGTVIEIAVVSSAPARASDETVNAYFQRIAAQLLIIGAVGIVLLVVNLVFYLLAGRSASARSGTVAGGAIGGLLTAVVSGVIGLIIGVAINSAGLVTSLQTSLSTSATPRGPGLTIIGGLVGIVVGAAIGAGVGALGGLWGKSAYDKANPPMPMGMPGAYPPGAYPPPPGAYPPPPGFPNQPMQ